MKIEISKDIVERFDEDTESIEVDSEELLGEDIRTIPQAEFNDRLSTAKENAREAILSGEDEQTLQRLKDKHGLIEQPGEDQLPDQYQQRLDKLRSKLESKEKKLSQAQDRVEGFRKRQKRQSILEGARQAGVKEDFVDSQRERFLRMYGDDFTQTEDGDVVMKSDSDEQQYEYHDGEPLTPSRFFKRQREQGEASFLFGEQRNQNTGFSPDTSSPTGETYTMEEVSKMRGSGKLSRDDVQRLEEEGKIVG